MSNSISKFYQSFSGTDTVAFLMMPGCVPVVIGSLTTISYSMYRNKKPVINIGRTNINGVTRGSRIFAGTMIFTLINQHWLRELQSQLSENYAYRSTYSGTYLAEVHELKVDELPLFDIMIVSANEYGSAVSMFIFGVDFTDEAQTISVEDLFTENTFSFIARDISVFRSFATDPTVSNGEIADGDAIIKDISDVKSFLYDNDNFNWSDVVDAAKEYIETKEALEAIYEHELDMGYMRDLYFSNSLPAPLYGKDVIFVQDYLKKHEYYRGELTGLYTDDVANAVKAFQSANGLEPTGRVDRRTWSALTKDDASNGEKKGIVINKNGAKIYSEPNLMSTIVETYSYNSSFLYDEVRKVIDSQGVVRYFLRTTNGWIYANDIYSINFDNDTLEFPTLSRKADNPSAYVILLQNALTSIYNDFKTFKYGVYDENTIKYVNKFQQEYGPKYGLVYKDGVVDHDVWIAIESSSDDNFGSNINTNFSVEMNRRPGNYNISYNDANAFKDFYVVFRTQSKVITKATAIIHFDDNTSIPLTQSITVKDGTKISATDYSDEGQSMMTTYYKDEESGKLKKAKWIEYIIYPYNAEPYKWRFYFTN